MTIRKTKNSNGASLINAPAVARVLSLTVIAFSLTACTTIFGGDKVDYKGAKKAAPLDVPPDLTKLQRDNRYAIPDGRGVATASEFQQGQAAAAASGVPAVAGVSASGQPIGPISTDAVSVQRNGDQRWLVVKQTPEQLWPQLRQFWEEQGFALEINNRVLGLHARLFVEPNPVPVKWALAEMGKMPAGLRLPLAPLSSQYHEIVRAALVEAGVHSPS